MIRTTDLIPSITQAYDILDITKDGINKIRVEV